MPCARHKPSCTNRELKRMPPQRRKYGSEGRCCQWHGRHSGQHYVGFPDKSLILYFVLLASDMACGFGTGATFAKACCLYFLFELLGVAVWLGYRLHVAPFLVMKFWINAESHCRIFVAPLLFGEGSGTFLGVIGVVCGFRNRVTV